MFRCVYAFTWTVAPACPEHVEPARTDRLSKQLRKKAVTNRLLDGFGHTLEFVKMRGDCFFIVWLKACKLPLTWVPRLRALMSDYAMQEHREFEAFFKSILVAVKADDFPGLVYDSKPTYRSWEDLFGRDGIMRVEYEYAESYCNWVRIIITIILFWGLC